MPPSEVLKALWKTPAMGIRRVSTGIVSGRVILELDDGVTKELGPGDTIVMNGTRHRWLNPFDEPCVRVAVMVGAEHDSV